MPGAGQAVEDECNANLRTKRGPNAYPIATIHGSFGGAAPTHVLRLAVNGPTLAVARGSVNNVPTRDVAGNGKLACSLTVKPAGRATCAFGAPMKGNGTWTHTSFGARPVGEVGPCGGGRVTRKDRDVHALSAEFSLRMEAGGSFDVRSFTVSERLSSLFVVRVTAVAYDDAIDLDALVGSDATFALASPGHAEATERVWSGICREIVQVALEASGLSTYELEIVPRLWLATERLNHRMFQHASDVDVAVRMLESWGVRAELRITGEHKRRPYRVQYGETDYAFLSRVLEDAGVTLCFGDGERLTLADTPQSITPVAMPIAFRDAPTDSTQLHARNVRVGRRLRPGKVLLRDHDDRRTSAQNALPLAEDGSARERTIERQYYEPGSFLVESTVGDETPAADDRGRYRHDSDEGRRAAAVRLESERAGARSITFETNALHVRPGVSILLAEHPRAEVSAAPLFVVETHLRGEVGVGCVVRAEARSAEEPHRPPRVTRRPRVDGLESATVVGPRGEEIHTDEFGRVRCHFHWDRESPRDETSSCWIHVSQPWSGAGMGAVFLPRVGDEVMVAFAGGDPDRPIVVGRVHTNVHPPPYGLPQSKTQSGIKTASTGGGGGFNEVFFDDAAGEELFRMQAERDRESLVKRDESVSVGRHLTKLVAADEREDTGKNRVVHVGLNRSAQIGGSDTIVARETITLIVPRADGSENPGASITVSDGKIVLDTGQGATLTLDKERIVIDTADEVSLTGRKTGVNLGAPSGLVELHALDEVSLYANGLYLIGQTVQLDGTTLLANGSGSATFSSGGVTDIKGTPIQLNGPGPFADRVFECTTPTFPFTPANLATGAAVVLIGGPSFPFPVVRQADGSIKVGDHITIAAGEGRFPDFQNKVLRDLGIMSSTPSGLQRLQNLENNPNGHDLTIREFTAAEEARFGRNNSLCYPQGDGATLTYDASGNPVPGSGTDSVIAYNPDIVLGPDGSPEPADAVLFHEMGHADHNANGTDRAGEAMGGGWENREEWQNIEGGVNEPGGTQVPGVPPSPSENEYLRDRNYPYRRTDHGSGYANPDGTPI